MFKECSQEQDHNSLLLCCLTQILSVTIFFEINGNIESFMVDIVFHVIIWKKNNV